MSENETETDAWPDTPDAVAEKGWQAGDPPEEGREGDQQDSGFEERGGQAP
jgi:hypothetical protein